LGIKRNKVVKLLLKYYTHNIEPKKKIQNKKTNKIEKKKKILFFFYIYKSITRKENRKTLHMACVGGLSAGQSLLYTKTKHSLPFASSPVGCSRNRVGRRFCSVRAETMATEKLGIKIERNPPESKLTQLGVRKWPKYVLSLSVD
jgi:hypothetical protein